MIFRMTISGPIIAIFAAICIIPVFPAETACFLNGYADIVADQGVMLSANGRDSTLSISLFKSGSGSLPASNCSLTVNAPNAQLLMLSFDVIDTRSCGEDEILVSTASSNGTLCGDYKCPNNNCSKTTFSNTTQATIEFHSVNDGSQQKHKGFHGTITAYSLPDPKTKSCPGENRFKCGNNRCIWEGLHCDGQNHCGDNSDEPPGCAKTVWGVIVIVLGVVAVCFFLPLFCYLAIWGPRRKVPIRIMGSTFFRGKQSSAINDEESVPILAGQPLQGTMPGETFTFYYGSSGTQNPRC